MFLGYMNIRTIKDLVYKVMPLWVFIFFALVFLAIQFSGSQMSSPDEPAYNIAHALSYKTGEVWQYPVYSTMTTHPADLYYLYHVLLSKFFIGFDGANYEVLVAGLKIFHALLVALIFTLFYVFVRSVFLTESDGVTRERATRYALVGTFFLFFASQIFIGRMYLPRPFHFAVLFLFCSFFFSMRRHHVPLFIFSFLMPWFYSVSFLVLIPPFLYLFAAKFYNRSARLPVPGVYTPLLVSVGGLIAGIITRPDSLNYLYNGSYLTVVSIFNFFGGVLPEGMELAPPGWHAPDFLTLLIFALICFVYTVRIRGSRHVDEVIDFPTFYALAVAFVFGLLMTGISRAGEYTALFLLFAIVRVIGRSGIPIVEKLTAGGYGRNASSPVLIELLRAAREVCLFMFGPKGVFAKIFYAICIVFFVGTAVRFNIFLRDQPPLDLYRGAAEYMQKHSARGDIVFQQRFDMYPRLVFYNTHNRYIAGFGNTFSYAYNRGLFRLWISTVAGGPICPRKHCEKEEVDTYSVIKDYFKAKFVFIDTSEEAGGFDVQYNPRFVERLDRDLRFKKVYADQKYPEIMVYEVL